MVASFSQRNHAPQGRCLTYHDLKYLEIYQKIGVTSLIKGFYEFLFSSIEDMLIVRALDVINMALTMLKIFSWTRDFNLNLQQESTTQVWIQIFGLAREYWILRILFAIVGSIGTRICIDVTTNKPRFDRDY